MTFLDRSDLQMKKMRPDGEIEVASMRPGPDGFVIAQFQGEAEQVTEVPNFSYELKSGKTKKQPKKKPAAALKKPAAATAAEKPAEDPDEPLSTKSYIQAKLENLSSKKKKLVVNLDKKKTANFVEIMERVMTRAESVLKLCKSTTFQELKETMVKYRDELVEEDAANDS
ncbi:Ank3 [Symbiodinium microadriaticum]|nr:Ank3 [Symbiodinium microadriaticum]